MKGKELIRAASEFAGVAHGTQKRKYTGELYINHPAAVAATVARYGGTHHMIAAAWLHDVVEDTIVPLREIKARFGSLVTYYVDRMSEKKVVGWNRASRKRFQASRIAGSGANLKLIKLADLYDNTATIVQHDPKFAEVYLTEIEYLLKYSLMDSSSDILWAIVMGQVAAARDSLYVRKLRKFEDMPTSRIDEV